jgi:tyrosyl-tRNA synthetase
MNFIEELQWRQLFKDCSDAQGLQERLKQPITLYCGFDPTADSLHIGHLQQLLLLKRFAQQGHHPIALLGGATGMIGDPRPTSERALVSLDVIASNVRALEVQMKGILGDSHISFVNNYDWFKDVSVLTFLRDYGKHFNVNYMINKDVVASRLDTGISFTEFTYTILQATDWLHLYEHHQCEMQVGGSDQWGNLTSGIELIRKVKGFESKVFGLTQPLITKADGSKFGKSEGQNIWLDSTKTHPYVFFQYFINVSDDDVINFLKRLSFESVETIQAIEAEHLSAPHLRVAQKRLAHELTRTVFGDDALASAIRLSDVYFNQTFETLSKVELEAVFEDALKVSAQDTVSLIDALVSSNIVSSNRLARELISSGAVSVNGIKVDDISYLCEKENAYHQAYTIIKKGKKNYVLIDFT